MRRAPTARTMLIDPRVPAERSILIFVEWEALLDSYILSKIAAWLSGGKRAQGSLRVLAVLPQPIESLPFVRQLDPGACRLCQTKSRQTELGDTRCRHVQPFDL